jgi:hypothetical protein
VFDREQRDRVAGQLVGRERVAAPVTGIDETALMNAEGVEKGP